MRAHLIPGFLASSIVIGSAAAGSLQISPVIMALKPRDAATHILLENAGDRPLYGQVRVFHWDQRPDEEVLADTDSIVASPPIVEIDAHQSQLVRIVRIDHSDLSQECAYRVVVDEIPRPEDAASSGVTVRLRYSVPLFITPRGGSRPKLHWQVRLDDKGDRYLAITNDGKTRAQISAVELVSGRQRYTINKGLLGYALAGHVRQWKLPRHLDGPLERNPAIHARVNGRQVEIPVAPKPPSF